MLLCMFCKYRVFFSLFLFCCNASAFVICVIKNYLLTYLYRKLFHFYRWESVRVFINGIGKLDFLHISKLMTAKFFKHLSMSKMVGFVMFFTITLSIAIGFCSCFMTWICSWTVLLRQYIKLFLVILTACDCAWFIYLFFIYFTFILQFVLTLPALVNKRVQNSQLTFCFVTSQLWYDYHKTTKLANLQQRAVDWSIPSPERLSVSLWPLCLKPWDSHGNGIR